MNNKFKLILSFFLVSILLAGAASAAPMVPDISDAVKQAVPPVQKDKPDNNIPAIQLNEPQKVIKLDNGARIFVKKFTITGNKHISTDQLSCLVNTADNLNKEYSFEDLGKLTSVITKFYRSKGYFVARAYFPKQDVVDNVVQIEVLEGYYGKFKLNNKSLVKDSTVQGMLDDIKDKNIISTTTIERAMLIINDTPGAVVTQADVMPGSDVGTSDFQISTEATKKNSGYAVFDNYGSRYTGKTRFMAGFNSNSPFSLGDKLSLSAMATGSAEIINGRIGYSLPLMYNGLRGEIAYARTNYQLGKEYDALDADGTSDSIDFLFDNPLLRTRLETLRLKAGFNIKRNVDKIDSTGTETKKKLISGNVGLAYNKSRLYFGIPVTTDISGNVTFGSLYFDDDAAEALDKAGADTNGFYTKVNAEITQNASLTPKVSLTLKLKGQRSLNNKNLDGSEDISVGGSNGVRLYPSGELSAENGYILNLETAYTLPVFNKFNSKIGLFYDLASASMENNVGSQPERTLQDAGFGYYAGYKNMFLKAECAFMIGGDKIESEPEYNRKYLLQAGMSF